MLGQLGLSFEMNGELLFPIGTLYDPFVRRGLDTFFYSVYSGAKFIVVGTPSGATPAPEGGSHQSLITASVGVEMPELAFYEPCFGQELEWIILDALEHIRLRKRSAYLRLTSKRVDQSLFSMPSDPHARERLRQQVLAGAYRLVDRRGEPEYQLGVNVVHIVACGAMVPEAVEASRRLLEEGVMANVINITGLGPLYTRFQQLMRSTIKTKPRLSEFMADVVPVEDRSAPIVTVIDGHPHSLAWLGSALNTPTLRLARIHRRTALGAALEEARGCSCESGIMVLEQKPARKQGAPNRCCHRTNPTVSASSLTTTLTTTAWWPMPGCSFPPPSPCALACPNSSGSTSTSAAHRAGRTPVTR